MSRIEYRTSERQKRVRISVLIDGSVVVSHPRRLSRARVESWVLERSAWIESAQAKMRARNVIALPTRTLQKKSEYKHMREHARTLVDERLSHYKDEFTWKRVRITNARTRWGSCSTRGTLSFNWRIALIPPELQEYLVVHELCHLLHHNHSSDFWNCVATYMPDYAQHKKALKRYHY